MKHGQSNGDRRERQILRVVMSVLMIGAGALFVFGMKNFLSNGLITLPWLGYFLIALGFAGLLGLNVFIGGPLDKRLDRITPPSVLPPVVAAPELEPSDAAALGRLIDRIYRDGDVNDPDVPRQLVTLEEFFEGNRDFGSIGYNFSPDQPSPEEFYAKFRTIRARPDVSDVRVEISQHEVAEEWPSTDTVWVMTTATLEEVKSWLGKRFRADELWDGWTDHLVREPISVTKPHRPVGVWWD